MPRLILVVCQGNIHRSVVAEICIRKNLKELDLENKFQVTSRGLQGSCQTATPKFPNLRQFPDHWPHAEPSLRELGIEILETQIATPVDESIARKASLILAMDQKVLSEFDNSLIKQFPELGFKMKLFSEMAGDVSDVPDCAEQMAAEKFRQVNADIHSTTKIGIQKMCQLAELLNPQTLEGE